MRLLGITGGIATGKSTVTRMFSDLGAPTLSADDLARELLAPGTEMTQVVLKAFPDCVDRRNFAEPMIDRRALSQVIFADAEARVRLEKMTHPGIIAGLTVQAAQWRSQQGDCAALEIPLLFEASLEQLTDHIIVVACRPEVQIVRLRTRLGIDEAEAKRQVLAQWPLEEKRDRAGSVITTDDGLDDTRRRVFTVWEHYCTEETKK
jgi:dephospho-CoA kinase